MLLGVSCLWRVDCCCVLFVCMLFVMCGLLCVDCVSVFAVCVVVCSVLFVVVVGCLTIGAC